MQITSGWPLPTDGIRFLTPHSLIRYLSQNPLSSSLYPIAMGYYPKAQQHQMIRHNHNNNLFIYCIAGRGTLTVDGKHYRVRGGDLIVLPKGQAHSYTSHSKYPWSIYWLHFDGHLSEEFYRHLDINGPLQPIGIQPKLIADLDFLFSLRHSAYNPDTFVHGCHELQQIMSYLALLVRQQRSQLGKEINLDDTRGFMQQHIHGHINLETLAKHSRLSKYHFSKRFKAMTGQSPIQYFINIKMQHACYLLDSSQQSVKQVAAVLGYDDAYYFSRLFKKIIGLSPDQYRKNKHR